MDDSGKEMSTLRYYRFVWARAWADSRKPTVEQAAGSTLLSLVGAVTTYLLAKQAEWSDAWATVLPILVGGVALAVFIFAWSLVHAPAKIHREQSHRISALTTVVGSADKRRERSEQKQLAAERLANQFAFGLQWSTDIKEVTSEAEFMEWHVGWGLWGFEVDALLNDAERALFEDTLGIDTLANSSTLSLEERVRRATGMHERQMRNLKGLIERRMDK